MNARNAWILLAMIALFFPAAQSLADTADDPTSTISTGLGQGFYLPSHDLLSAFSDGKNLFSAFKKGCFQTAPLAQSSQDIKQYTSTSAFESYLRVQAGLSGTYTGSTTLEGTVQGVYSHGSGSATSLQGVAIDVISYTGTLSIEESCLSTGTLEEDFVRDFEALPVTIKDPYVENNWSHYSSFLTSYGSHVMQAAYIGARFQQWVLASTEKKYSYDDFTMRACAAAEGADGDGYTASACASYTSAAKKHSESYDMQTKIYVLGGTSTTRNQLLVGRSKELLEDFLQEDKDTNQAVRHEWIGIWDLLTKRYPSGDNYTRALNLQAYYQGLKDFTCPHITTDDGKIDLQKFELKEKSGDSVTYACWIRGEGCYDSNNCHLGGAGSVCYCYGDACTEYVEDDNGIDRPKNRKSRSGSYDSGVNNSCNYHFIAHCDCDTSWGSAKDIWVQNQTTNSTDSPEVGFAASPLDFEAQLSLLNPAIFDPSQNFSSSAKKKEKWQGGTACVSGNAPNCPKQYRGVCRSARYPGCTHDDCTAAKNQARANLRQVVPQACHKYIDSSGSCVKGPGCKK